jgi:hypothetical protein
MRAKPVTHKKHSHVAEGMHVAFCAEGCAAVLSAGDSHAALLALQVRPPWEFAPLTSSKSSAKAADEEEEEGIGLQTLLTRPDIGAFVQQAIDYMALWRRACFPQGGPGVDLAAVQVRLVLR